MIITENDKKIAFEMRFFVDTIIERHAKIEDPETAFAFLASTVQLLLIHLLKGHDEDFINSTLDQLIKLTLEEIIE